MLIVAALISPGAWRITHLPALPEAAASHLIVLALWFAAAGLGLMRLDGLDRRLAWGLLGVGVVTALSWVAGGSLLQVAFYDLYASMPLVQWLAYPAAFALVAGLRLEWRWVRAGLCAAVAVGALMSMVLAYQQLTLGGITYVFGTTAYSITALVALIPVAVGLGATERGRIKVACYGAAGVISLCVGAFSGATMGTLATVFAVLVAVAVHPRAWRSGGLPGTMALGLAGLAVLAMLVVSVPAISGSVVGPDAAGRDNESVASRVYLWRGAQAMFLEHPWLGVGPGGYRTRAVEYLDPEALSFGPDQPGNIDPGVYSPQSPHSLLWEIATRLGVVGLVAFGALFALWGWVLRDRLRPGEEGFSLRAGMAAGFVAALFSLMVNPVVFVIGLFAPVAAGLAVATAEIPSPAREPSAAPRRWPWLAVAGVLVAAVALWQVWGEWTAQSVSPEDPFAAIEAHERALDIVPGNPVIERRLLGFRLLVAGDAAGVAAAQAAVDEAPGYIGAFVPNSVSLAGISLAQAQRTGRTDVTWERRILDEAALRIPPIPSLVAERLHVALIEGDIEAVRLAVPDAKRWGGPYPYTASYLQRAAEMLSR